VALEQYIDVNPWEGLRFGSLNPPESGEFHGVSWQNRTYDVTIGPHRTALVSDGNLQFEADGPVVVRHDQPQAFTIKSVGPVQVTIAESDSGSLRLRIDGQPSGSIAIQQGRATFALGAGEHAVELSR
jgi:hypothetical protein